MGEKLLSDEQLLRVINSQRMYTDDADYAYLLRVGRAVEMAVAVQAGEMSKALKLIIRRLQADIDDGSRPDQWSMEMLMRVARESLPSGTK